MATPKMSNRFMYLEEIFRAKNVYYDKEIIDSLVSYTYYTRTSKGTEFCMNMLFTFDFHALFRAIGFVDEKCIASNKNKVLRYIDKHNAGDHLFNFELKGNEIWAMSYPPETETVLHIGDVLEPRQVFNTLCDIYDFVCQHEATILAL